MSPLLSDEEMMTILEAPRVIETLEAFAQQHNDHRHLALRGLTAREWQNCSACRQMAGFAIEAIAQAIRP